MRLAPFNRFKPSSKSIFTDRSKAALLLWIVFVSYASCCRALYCCVCSFNPCGHLLRKGWPCLCCVTFPDVFWSSSELRARLAPWNWFKPSSKIFYWPFQGVTSFVDLLNFCSVLCLLCLCAHLFICALWSPAGKGLTSWLSFVVSNCEFVTFPLVSCVRCGTWLYRFLIFYFVQFSCKIGFCL